MSILSDLRALSPKQRHAIVASYLGWTLDAFDFFIFVFVLKDVAHEFSTSVKAVTLAITLTLALRPLGALIFGMMADRFGRRPVLMVNILFYSVLECASGFAPSLTSLIILRALYGVAMGGEWGVGASLTLESVPEKVRGLVSGILQAGYPSGYLLASITFYSLFAYIGWRGMFMVGIMPALLVLYIRRHVDESPVFLSGMKTRSTTPPFHVWRQHAGLFFGAIAMMTCFNFLSHGTQDLYPTFLEQQRGLSTHAVSLIAITYNVGAILGSLTFGFLSNKLGRKRAIITAALFVLPIIPLWTEASTSYGLALGAFLIQFFVQGAWGVIPAHLNEISPGLLRGTFPGLVYQLGNLLASSNATLEATLAADLGGDYALALSVVVGCVAFMLAAVTYLNPEARGRNLKEIGTL